MKKKRSRQLVCSALTPLLARHRLGSRALYCARACRSAVACLCVRLVDDFGVCARVLCVLALPRNCVLSGVFCYNFVILLVFGSPLLINVASL